MLRGPRGICAAILLASAASSQAMRYASSLSWGNAPGASPSGACACGSGVERGSWVVGSVVKFDLAELCARTAVNSGRRVPRSGSPTRTWAGTTSERAGCSGCARSCSRTSLDDPEHALDLVEPAGVLGRQVPLPSRMLVEPGLNVIGVVCEQLVAHDVPPSVRRTGCHDVEQLHSSLCARCAR